MADDFNKIVKKLLNKTGEIISIGTIEKMLRGTEDVKNANGMFKLVYRLKNADVIVLIRNGVYYVSNGNGKDVNTILDETYWKLIAHICKNVCGGNAFISGNTAMQLLLKNQQIPPDLVLVTKTEAKNLSLGNNLGIRFKTVASGGKTGRDNLFPALFKNTQNITVDGAKLYIATPELAILDGLLLPEKMDMTLLTNFLRKYAKSLNAETIANLTKTRYISAVNRLKHLALDQNDARLYDICLQSIKKQGGGCFLSRKNLKM